MTSKSNWSSRCWYCDESTSLILVVTPSFSRFLTKGAMTRSNSGETIRNSISRGSPPEPTSLVSSTVQPASPSSLNAVRRLRRALPDPSVSGGAKTSLKTSGGNWSRKGSSSASSAPSGRPDDASSEFEK